MPTTPLIPRYCDHCHTQTNGTTRRRCQGCNRLICSSCNVAIPVKYVPVVCVRCHQEGKVKTVVRPEIAGTTTPETDQSPTELSIDLSDRSPDPLISQDPVTTYARAIVSGAILANRWVKLACQRHLSDLTRDDLFFDTKRAQQIIDFFRLFLRLSTGRWEGKPFVLLDFQEFIQGSIFGWYWRDPADKWTDQKGVVHYRRRRFEVVYIEAPKGLGKSPMSAGTGIFCTSWDNNPRAECFFFASKKEQAEVSFGFVLAMIDQSPFLKARFLKTGEKKVLQVTDPKTGSYIKPIASDDKKSGPTVHFAGGDELHEHPDDVVVSMMRQGMKGDNPLLYLTTNSGTDRTSVCWQQRLQATQMLTGSIPNDSLFAYICGLDDEELKVMGLMKPERDDPPITTQDPIDFLLAHEELWIKANPAIGRVRSYEYVRKRLVEAKGLPSQRNRVLRLNFCVWTDSLTVWIPDSVWIGCGDVSLSNRVVHPRFGVMTRLEQELIGKRCYGGLDMARGAGFHAVVLLFPDDEGVLSQEVLDRRLINGSVDLPEPRFHEEVVDADQYRYDNQLNVWLCPCGGMVINRACDRCGRQIRYKSREGESAPSIRDPNNQLYSLLEFYFMDEEAFSLRAQDSGIFHTWREDGDLFVHPEILALGSLADFITGTLSTRYSISELAYDPAFVSPQIALNLEQAGVKMVEWVQQYRLMDAPIREAERRCKVGLFRHRAHPITRWHMQNAETVEDRGGRRILNKARLTQNIDGASALVTGLGWAMRSNQGPPVVRRTLVRVIEVGR